MSTRIPYDETTAIGQLLAEYAAHIAEAKAKAGRLKDQFTSMASGGTYEQIEAEIGGMVPGDGEIVNNIIIGSAVGLETGDLAALPRLDKG